MAPRPCRAALAAGGLRCCCLTCANVPDDLSWSPSIAASPPTGKGEIRRAIATPPASPHDFIGFDFQELDFQELDFWELDFRELDFGGGGFTG
jgi:hypothetical protein